MKVVIILRLLLDSIMVEVFKRYWKRGKIMEPNEMINNNDKCIKKYIRFGDLPEGLVSKIHKGDGVYEQDVKGVSVWNCLDANALEYPILPLNPNEDAIADYFNLLYSDRPIYVVTGTEIGIGRDGEPVLGNDIKILENITEWYSYRHGR